jgi:hypothetical protein
MFYDIYLYTLCYYICCLLGACMRCTRLCSLKPGVTRRPGKPLRHFSIQCTDSLYITPWSSPGHWIELDRRDMAGTPAADEDTRLRTWTERFRPSPPSSPTLLWPPEPPRANPAPRRTSLASGKPATLFFPADTVYIRGRTSGKKKERSGGFLNCQWLRGIVTQG